MCPPWPDLLSRLAFNDAFDRNGSNRVSARHHRSLVATLNCTLRARANYFNVGTVTKAYRAIDNYSASAVAPTPSSCVRSAKASAVRLLNRFGFHSNCMLPDRVRRNGPRCIRVHARRCEVARVEIRLVLAS